MQNVPNIWNSVIFIGKFWKTIRGKRIKFAIRKHPVYMIGRSIDANPVRETVNRIIVDLFSFMVARRFDIFIVARICGAHGTVCARS